MSHPRFNHSFTDEDMATLVSLAPIANQPQHCYHRCGWSSTNGLCNLDVLGHEFSEHLRVEHGITGPDKMILACAWSGCSAPMRKESLVRHVQEKHLEWRYTCPNCHERFTRNYTKEQHMSKKHPGPN